MKEISKYFPGVKALDRVDFDILSGEVHALVGENGAGKSTLIKLLGGVHQPDTGKILINGKEVNFNNPKESQKYGISVIHQEFSLVPELNVGQNIFMGNEMSSLLGIIKWREIYDKTKKLLGELDIDIDPRIPVRKLPVAQQQMVEIAKALNTEAKILIMDEPTSAITEEDKDRLFEIIRDLKNKGVGIIYISHRMPEIFEIADRVTVLRDGQHVGTNPVKSVTEDDLVKMMVGRHVDDIYSRDKKTEKKEAIFEVKNLTKYGSFENISFKLHRGQVLGLSGLIGAGRTEIVRCIFGADDYDEGEILYEGKPLVIEHPSDAIEKGIGLVPEDRTKDGFVPMMSVKDNLCLPSLPWINKLGWVIKKKEREISEQYIKNLNIITPSDKQSVEYLSGGNKQKIILGKWLARNPKVLILDEPTRGIDVGAKSEIHDLIQKLAEQDVAILMISSELPEILGISDDIIVLHEGQITGRFNHEEANEEKIMFCATGSRK